MAIARLSVKVGKAGKAGAHAEYIEEDEEEKRKDLEHSDYGNMPAWAEDNPMIFWQSADLYERKNGSTYREYEIALPRELNEEQRLELVQDFIKTEIGTKYPYQYAIHNPQAMDGKDQPHVHLMFNERLQDGIERDPDQYFKRYNPKNPECGGAKKDNTGKSHLERKTELKDLRQRWAELCNSHLERNGIDSRIDMRSYKDQGIDKEPEKKLLPSQAKNSEVREALQSLREANRSVERLNREVATELYNPSQKRESKAPKRPNIFKMPSADALAQMDIKTRVKTFLSKADEIAKHVEAKEVKRVKEEMTQLHKQIKEHDQKEPMFFKKKWREERENLVKEFHSNKELLARPFSDYLSFVQGQMKKQDVWKPYNIDGDIRKVGEMEKREWLENHLKEIDKKIAERDKGKPPKQQEKDLGDSLEM